MGKRTAMMLAVVFGLAHLCPPAQAQAPSDKSTRAELRETVPNLPRLRQASRNVRRTERTEGEEQVVVRFRKGADHRAALRDAGASAEESIPELNVEVVTSDEDPESLANELRADKRVISAEADRLRYASKVPNDPGFGAQGHLLFSRFPLAWEITTGSSSLDIAILDTGVDLDHPDLAARIVAGRDTVNEDATAQDDDGHGTIVAGVAAASTNNSIGVAGAAFNARIMPVKVLDSNGGGNDSDIAQGIIWATDHGAEVINMSFGGTDTSTVLDDAVAYAISKGVIVVAAAGNESSNVPNFPAASPGVIAVGATDLFGEYVNFSNYGAWVDVFAPGTDIVSTALDTQEAYVDGAVGTSFSSPIVAGVAGLVHTLNPAATPELVENWLKYTTVGRSAPTPGSYRWLDAYASTGGRPAAQPGENYPGAPGLRSDFNGDGHDDAVVGAPNEDVGSIRDAGAVQLFYGGEPDADILFTQDSGGVPGTAETGDRFGAAIATGDVNRDGYDDLAIGAPYEDFGGIRDSGVAYLFLGSPTGLRVSQSWQQGSNGVAGSAETNDLFGFALSLGDYDGIAGDDLAIGAPGESEGSKLSVGAVTVLSGRSGGVTGSGSKQWLQEVRVAGNLYGFSLASGDFDSDTNDELAIGAPGTNGSAADSGAVEVLHGTVLGLRRDFVLTPELLRGDAQPAEYFGTSISIGDVMAVEDTAQTDIDTYDDIAIGSPGADNGAGRVDVIGSDWAGIGARLLTLEQQWSSDAAAEPGDAFGSSLASTQGEQNNDHNLIIGVPGEDVGSKKDAGAVFSYSIDNESFDFVSQDLPGIPGTAETGDRFGASVAVGQYGMGGREYLVGSPDESVGSIAQAGVAFVVFNDGLGTQLQQGSAGAGGVAEPGDRVGAAVG